MGIGRGFDTGTNVYVTVCDINFLRFQVQTRLQGILLIIKSVLPGSFIYRMRAVISRGLYIFENHFFLFQAPSFQGGFSENSVLLYGSYSRAVYNGARTVGI